MDPPTIPNFEFVHPTIAQVLQCHQTNAKMPHATGFLSYDRHHDDEEGCDLLSLQFPETATIQDLIDLAHECDEWIYYYDDNNNSNEKNLPPLQRWREETEATSGGYYTLALAESARNVATTTTTTNMVATLLALNALESAVREATGYTTGKAPLLKTMLGRLSALTTGGGVDHACRLLLLPTPGLNLRNLLWHGFVTELPRPWLSLVLVLTRILLKTTKTKTNNTDTAVKMKTNNARSEPTTWTTTAATYSSIQIHKVPEFARLLECATTDTDILDFPPTLKRNRNEGSSSSSPSSDFWLPPSHLCLYQDVVVSWIQQRRRPATCCALLSILLEHGLRLDWCLANDRPDDCIARPRAFYVTLDGHGQRQVHDLLLHPYVLGTHNDSTGEDSDKDNQESKDNALLTQGRVPISTLALMTDLFCSSSGGPNLRAAVSHGLWDDWLKKEWTDDTVTMKEEDEHVTASLLWDMVRLLLLAMDSVASQTPIHLPSSSPHCFYRPVFSYTAVTRRALCECRRNLQALAQLSSSFNDDTLVHREGLSSSMTTTDFQDEIPEELRALQGNIFFLKLDSLLLSETFTDRNDEYWTTAQSRLDEHELNQRLSTKGMTRALLEDVATASHQLLEDVEEALHQMKDSSSSMNRRKQKGWWRMVHSSRAVGLHLYTLALNVAILSLDDKDDNDANLNKAIQRTRMVVSTTQTFLKPKVDRARKSIVEYTKGKAICQVATRIVDRRHADDQHGY